MGNKLLLLKTLIATLSLVWVPTTLASNVESKRPDTTSPSHRALQEKSNLETVQTKSVLSTFNAAIQQTQLEDALQGATVVMPWDKAWEQEEILGKLMSDPQWMAHLQNVVLSHIHPSPVPLETMATVQSLSMENGDNMGVIAASEMLYFDEAQVIAYDKTTDGYAYMTKTVLMPTFLSQGIVEVVSSTASISTLKSLLVTAGLDHALSDKEDDAPMTIFAPSNEAFAAADPESLAYLQTAEGSDDLKNLLLYHVLLGVVPSMNLDEGTTQVETLSGEPMVITKTNPDVIVLNDQATVTSADILAMDGIVHVIDSVLVPINQNEIDAITGSSASAPASLRYRGITAAASGMVATTLLALALC